MSKEHTLSTAEARPRKQGLVRSERPERLLAWYRERDRDPLDLHRRYVRAKYAMGRWSDDDLARYHRYRRSVSCERAAQLVVVRRYAVRGLSAAAMAALVASVIYAAYQWWKQHTARRVLPAPSKKAGVSS